VTVEEGELVLGRIEPSQIVPLHRSHTNTRLGSHTLSIRIGYSKARLSKARACSHCGVDVPEWEADGGAVQVTR